jgi:Fe-S cluster assembly protein SufD
MMGAQSPKAEALSQRLAALTLPVGLPAAREAALSRLSAMGLPTRRDEYWRYTDPVSLTAIEPIAAGLYDASDEAPFFDAVDRLKLVFTDGAFDAEASDDLMLAGVEISRLADSGAACDMDQQAIAGIGGIERREGACWRPRGRPRSPAPSRRSIPPMPAMAC